MKKKNSKKSSKQLIAVLLILATFSVLSASFRTNKIMFKQVDAVAMPEIIEQVIGVLPVLSASEEPVVSANEVTTPASLAVCDMNADGVRDLRDVPLFSACQDTFDANGDGIHDLIDIALYASMNQDNDFCYNTFKCAAQPTAAKVLGEKISDCKIDADVAGQIQWADGSLIRACDMKVYRIENQNKRHIVSIKDLFKYIGQRIYNVTDDIVALF